MAPGTLTIMPEVPGAIEARQTCPPCRRRRGPAVVRIGLFVVGWLIVAVLGLIALLRLLAWDSLEPLIVLDALSLIVYLPAWVVAVGALIARRWWLAAAAVVVVAAQLTFVAPGLLAAAPVPEWTRHAPVVRVFDANIDKSLRFEAGYVQAVEQYRPDVVTLEEFTPPAQQAMAASGVLARFPYRCSAPAYGATGFLIASRLRLTGCRVRTVWWDGQWTPYMVEATLSSPGGPVALRLVHTLAPFPAYWREWSAALAAVGRSVRASGDSRMLMVGDFNATWGNSGFVALLHDGLTDGAAARGKATDMTWPNGAVIPPFVRIDHVLTGARLAATRAGVLRERLAGLLPLVSGEEAARPAAPAGSPPGDCLAVLDAVTRGLRRFPGMAGLAAHEAAAHLSAALWLAPPVPSVRFNTSLPAVAAIAV
jgi:endonuclease/exonuclease/phosphatase (EEP) superfamily protein YafD